MRHVNTRKLGFIILVCILSSIAIGSTACSQADADEVYRDFAGLFENYDEQTKDFSDLNQGDKVLIIDLIEYIRYNETLDKTKIWFHSEDDLETSRYLSMIGDANKDFDKDDKVRVWITIDEVQGEETYTASLSDIDHFKEKKEEVDKDGIDILGYHFEFPEQLQVLDNNYGRFLVKFLLWLIIALIVTVILDPVIRRMTEKTETKIDDIILDIIRKPILVLLILYGVVSSLRELSLPGEIVYWIECAYSVGFFLMIIWIGYKVFTGILLQLGHAIAKRTKYQVDKILVPAIHKLGTIIIAFIALSAILGYLQIDLTLFVAGGVVISMVIAFAAQDTLSNFFSGIFLILEPKFKVGDMIQFEGDTYIVAKIGMRTTVLYDLFKHIEVVMPNNKLANEKLINITEPDRRLKESCEVGVAYGSDPQKVQDLLMEIVMHHPDIITDDPKREPFTRFTKFGDSSIDFSVGFWVEDLDDRFRVKSEINHEIYNRFAREGIQIPFPQRDLHIRSDEGKAKKGAASRLDISGIKKNKRFKGEIKRLKRGKLEMGSEDFGGEGGGNGDGE